MSRVKRRQAPGWGTVPFLEGYDVIVAANDLFQFRWSFDLLGEPQVMRWERQVTVYDHHARKKVPLIGEDGRPVYEPVGICYITGRVQSNWAAGFTVMPMLGAVSSPAIHLKPWTWPSPAQPPIA